MKLLLLLSIFVIMVTVAALPVNKIPVDEAAVPGSIPGVFHENERVNRTCTRRIDCGAGVCWDGHCYYDNRVECFPDRTCDTGTCYHGYCYVDEEDIPWDDEDKPNNIDNGDSDNNNDNGDGDVAKRDGFWGIGDDDKIFFREMIDDIHHRAKAKPSTAKRDSQSDEDMEDSVPTFCSIPGEFTAYGPVRPPEKRDTNKDVNCHNDEQCSPGICQDGICLLKYIGLLRLI